MFVSNAQAAMRLQMSCASRVLGAAALRNGNGSTSFFSSSSSSSSSVSAEAAAVFEVSVFFERNKKIHSYLTLYVVVIRLMDFISDRKLTDRLSPIYVSMS